MVFLYLGQTSNNDRMLYCNPCSTGLTNKPARETVIDYRPSPPGVSRYYFATRDIRFHVLAHLLTIQNKTGHLSSQSVSIIKEAENLNLMHCCDFSRPL